MWKLETLFFLMARAFSEAICIHAPPLSLDNWSFSGRLVAWNPGMKHHCLKSSIALSLGSVRFFCMNDLGFGQCDAPTLGSGVGVTALSAGYGHSCILDTQGAVLQHQSKPFIIQYCQNKGWPSLSVISHNFNCALILPTIQCMASILVPRSPPLLWGQHLRPMRRADWIGLHHRGLHSSRISAQLRSHSARCASMLWWQQWLAMNLKWISCQPFRFSPSNQKQP